MNETTCPHCQNTRFELHGETVAGSALTLTLLRCSACAAPVAVLPSHDRDLAATLTELRNRLDQMLKMVG